MCEVIVMFVELPTSGKKLCDDVAGFGGAEVGPSR